MRYTHTLLLAILMPFFFLSCSIDELDESTLYGEVKDYQNRPLADATIEVIVRSVTYVGKSSANGEYSMVIPDRGPAFVSFMKEDYKTSTVNTFLKGGKDQRTDAHLNTLSSSANPTDNTDNK